MYKNLDIDQERQKADEGVGPDCLQEEDVKFLCGCGTCTLDDFLREGCSNPSAQKQFPLLNVTKETTHTLSLVARLIKEANEVAVKFCDLLLDVLSNLESRQDISVDHLVIYIAPQQRICFLSDPHYTEIQTQLREAASKGEVMRLLESHVSWFNHSLLGTVVKRFGVSVEKYENYVENHLKPFLEKSLFEIPKKSSDSFEGSGHFVLKLSIPPQAANLAANVLIPLKQQVATAFGLSINALEFSSYDSGCFELTFSAPYKLLKEGICDSDRLALIYQNVKVMFPGVKIQAIKFDGECQSVKPFEVSCTSY